MTNAPEQMWVWRFAPNDTPPQDDLYFGRARPALIDLALAEDLTPYTLTRLHDAVVAERDALRAQVNALREALIWCSGSNDFNEGGIAREGWLWMCAPLLPAMPEKGTPNE